MTLNSILYLQVPKHPARGETPQHQLETSKIGKHEKALKEIKRIRKTELKYKNNSFNIER